MCAFLRLSYDIVDYSVLVRIVFITCPKSMEETYLKPEGLAHKSLEGDDK